MIYRFADCCLSGIVISEKKFEERLESNQIDTKERINHMITRSFVYSKLRLRFSGFSDLRCMIGMIERIRQKRNR